MNNVKMMGSLLDRLLSYAIVRGKVELLAESEGMTEQQTTT